MRVGTGGEPEILALKSFPACQPGIVLSEILTSVFSGVLKYQVVKKKKAMCGDGDVLINLIVENI